MRSPLAPYPIVFCFDLGLSFVRLYLLLLRTTKGKKTHQKNRQLRRLGISRKVKREWHAKGDAGAKFREREMWDVWKSLFLEAVNKHASMRKRKVKSESSPWTTAELRQKMGKRDFLRKQQVKQNSHQVWNDYKKARNEVNASIREARATFFNDSIKKHSGNLKETWNVINSSLGRKPKMTVINELVYEGKDFVQKQDIAEQMNNHFC